MKHPFEVLKPEYTQLLSVMTTTKLVAVDTAAKRLLRYVGNYSTVSASTGIPIAFIAASFEREASSNFLLSPAQGDPWHKVSTHVPRGRGPFTSWTQAALDAYHLNGLDKVGTGRWTWELACYYGELFNGFGYRGKGLRSPYLWGGSNLQQIGKYTSDGHFDHDHWDAQLGIIPIMERMVQLDPTLDFNPIPLILPTVTTVPEGVGGGQGHDTAWIQNQLNKWRPDLGLVVDDNYGKKTTLAVREYQKAHGLEVDGFVGKLTQASLEKVT